MLSSLALRDRRRGCEEVEAMTREVAPPRWTAPLRSSCNIVQSRVGQDPRRVRSANRSEYSYSSDFCPSNATIARDLVHTRLRITSEPPQRWTDAVTRVAYSLRPTTTHWRPPLPHYARLSPLGQVEIREESRVVIQASGCRIDHNILSPDQRVLEPNYTDARCTHTWSSDTAYSVEWYG